jgi:hypothetical protein
VVPFYRRRFPRPWQRIFHAPGAAVSCAVSSLYVNRFPATDEPSETVTIVVLSLVEPESLLVQVSAQVSRINTDVSPFEGPSQEAPEILDIVSVDLSANKLNRVVNSFHACRRRKDRDRI